MFILQNIKESGLSEFKKIKRYVSAVNQQA